MAIKVEFTNNSQAFLSAIPRAQNNALERCGEEAEGIASDLCPKDTGALAGSIHHQVADDMVAIGTNMEYGPYVELGTGVYYPGGRKTPWCYQDSHGNWHMTNGQRAQPYLKPAVADNTGTYKNIIEDAFKNA